jgi:hypothetical protein
MTLAVCRTVSSWLHHDQTIHTDEVSWVFGIYTIEAQVTTWCLSHEDDDIANASRDLVAELAPKNSQRGSLEHLMQTIFKATGPPLSTDFSTGTIGNTEASDFTIGLPAPSSGRAK